MNGWIVFQLLVDVALFAIIVVYLIRSGHEQQAEIDSLANGQNDPQPEVDIDQIEKLLDELARLVMRAEKVAVRIEKGVEAEADRAQAEPDPVQAKNPPAEKELPPARKAVDKNPLGDKQYSKATKLIKKGMTNEEIGQIVGLPAHEIGLIRRMGA